MKSAAQCCVCCSILANKEMGWTWIHISMNMRWTCQRLIILYFLFLFIFRYCCSVLEGKPLPDCYYFIWLSQGTFKMHATLLIMKEPEQRQYRCHFYVFPLLYLCGTPVVRGWELAIFYTWFRKNKEKKQLLAIMLYGNITQITLHLDRSNNTLCHWARKGWRLCLQNVFIFGDHYSLINLLWGPGSKISCRPSVTLGSFRQAKQDIKII